MSISIRCPKCKDYMRWVTTTVAVEVTTRIAFNEVPEGSEIGILPGGRTEAQESAVVVDRRNLATCPQCGYNAAIEDFDIIYNCPHCGEVVIPASTNYCYDLRAHICEDHIVTVKNRYCDTCSYRGRCEV